MRRRLLLVCCLLCFAPALAQDGGVVPRAEAPSKKPAAATLLARPVDTARVDRVFKSLDLRARAAQLVMAYPQISKSGPVEVGGVLFVGAALNNLKKAKDKLVDLNSRARIPPFVSVDMEGGKFNRMKRYPGLADLPVARDMAALSDAEVRAWGVAVGRAMKDLGLNMNLAPVLDVAASGHMANNQRSYSGDPKVVAAKARAFSEGLLAAGVVPIGKHFPGYGDFAGDSDHELAVADWTEAKVLKQVATFDAARDVLGGVMLSNIAYTAFQKKPAILTPAFATMAHERGLISVTDDISIQALADSVGGTSEDVLREALLAGNDFLLTTAPPDWDKGLDYVGLLVRFAEEDEVARQRIDAACLRVLALKDRAGLLDRL